MARPPEVLDTGKNKRERWRVDQQAREQIRLILDDADARSRRAVHDRLTALYADHSARGGLQSGATVKLAVSEIETIASSFVASCVDRVAAVAKDIEAFDMLHAAVEGLLRYLEGSAEEAVSMATGRSEAGPAFEGVSKAATKLFDESRTHLRRQLELQRFTFTVPYHRPATAPVTATSSQAPIAKSRGGKPLAAHWDELWASIAVMLYAGDLQPKTQADVERAMKEWLAARNLDAGDTAVRNRARQLWLKLQQDS